MAKIYIVAADGDYSEGKPAVLIRSAITSLPSDRFPNDVLEVPRPSDVLLRLTDQMRINWVSQSDVVLVVFSKDGIERLRTDHYNREEFNRPLERDIEVALASKLKIVPVLWDGATMPPIHAVPEYLKKLFMLNALQTTSDTLDRDLNRLLTDIRVLEVGMQHNKSEQAQYDVFVAYSRQDQKVVEPVIRVLQSLGLSVFYDIESIKHGANWRYVCDRAIVESKVGIGLFSPQALGSSHFRREISELLHYRKLLPAYILPIPRATPDVYLQYYRSDLIGFDGNTLSRGWKNIMRELAKRLGRGALVGYSDALGLQGAERARVLSAIVADFPDDPLAKIARRELDQMKTAYRASAETLSNRHSQFDVWQYYRAAGKAVAALPWKRIGKTLASATATFAVLGVTAFGLTQFTEVMARADARPEAAQLKSGIVTPDGRYAVILRDDGAAVVQTAAGDPVGVVRGHGAAIVSAHVGPDGRLVTLDRTGRMLQTDLARLDLRERGHGDDVAGAIEYAVWRGVLEQPAGKLWSISARHAPWSAYRDIMDPSRSAPILPPGLTPPPGTMFRDCVDCPEMVVVPGGTFLMGSPETEEGRGEDEGPQHEVTIPAAFAVGRFEVSVGEFRRFVGETGRDIDGGCFSDSNNDGTAVLDEHASWASPGFTQTDDHPVTCVSWDDAQAYVKWISDNLQKSYRLLSEKEFEYILRASKATIYQWGNEASAACNYANVGDDTAGSMFPGMIITRCRDGYSTTAPRGTFDANQMGIFDASGNVSEWVQGCFVYYLAKDPYTEEEPPNSTCEFRVIRGGSWATDASVSRSAIRGAVEPERRDYDLGFRVARKLY